MNASDTSYDYTFDFSGISFQELDDIGQALDCIGAVEPTGGLSAIGLLREYLDEREADLVLKARVEGMPWAEIGRLLRRSRQAAWEKYHDPDPRDTPDE
jgi:hypothetical protein